jgi:hypothetical protein
MDWEAIGAIGEIVGAAAMFVQFDAIEAAYLQYRKGVLSGEDWAKWKNVLLNFMASPGGQNFWTKTRGNFTESFRDVVETSEPVASYDYRGAI